MFDFLLVVDTEPEKKLEEISLKKSKNYYFLNNFYLEKFFLRLCKIME